MALLLLPCLAFLAIGIVSWADMQIVYGRRDGRDKADQYKWEAFLQKIDNGATLKYDKVTEDSMLEALRVEKRYAAAEEALNEHMRKTLHHYVGLAVSGIVLQVTAALLVRKRILREKAQVCQRSQGG